MANVVTETYQNPNMPVFVTMDSGERHNIATVNATLRGARGVSVNVDVFDPELCEANADAVTEAVMAFVRDVFSQAAAQGVPVSGSVPAVGE